MPIDDINKRENIPHGSDFALGRVLFKCGAYFHILKDVGTRYGQSMGIENGENVVIERVANLKTLF